MIKADQFSKLSIADSWTAEDKSDDAVTKASVLSSATSMDVGVHVESNNEASKIKGFRRDLEHHGNVTFPYYTAIVTVDNGDVTGVEWDDGCLFCSNTADSCTQNTYDYDGTLLTKGDYAGEDCYVKDSTCVEVGTVDPNTQMASTSVSDACTLSVYVVWAGTDSEGRYMQSSRLRFSQFRGYQLQSYRDDVQGNYGYAGVSVTV